MDQGPLITEQIDAGAKFLAEFQKYHLVQSAFWLKDSDEGNWYLCVASDQINDDNVDVVYGDVLPIAKQIQDPWFDPFEVKLIGADDPRAKDALEILRRPGRTPTRFHSKTFGGISVDEVYVYPSPIPVPAQ